MTGTSERHIAAFVRAWRANGHEDASTLRREFARWLEDPDSSARFPRTAVEDPHALGWLHQYLSEETRDAAFAAHTRAESKHTSQTATTQVYTPRWVADWLAMHAIGDDEPGSILDPACGGGQMLLAAAEVLIDRGADPTSVFARLRGVDLDPEAVWTCRQTLKLAARRAIGTSRPELEASIDANVETGDALFDAVRPADVVLTNPPYMGSRSMPAELKAQLRVFEPFHLDLYLAFVRRCAALANRSVGILAQQTLWYLKRFERARRWMAENGRLTHLAHLGHGIFGALQGEKATVVAFVWRPSQTDASAEERPTSFWDLREEKDKRSALRREPRRVKTARFEALPAAPLAFWLPDRLLAAFDDRPRLADVAEVPGSQNKTGRNAKYVRERSAVDIDDPRWVPYSKGGRFAPWWGNWDWVVDWSDEARTFYASNPTSNLLDERYWFREGLCYSDFGGKHFNARWMPPGCVFDMAGPAIFVPADDADLLAAIMTVANSTASRAMLNALNPTLHYQVRDVRNLPLPAWSDADIARYADVGHELVRLTREALEGRTEPRDILRLEQQADQLVAAGYGCPAVVEPLERRRLHHRLDDARR